MPDGECQFRANGIILPITPPVKIWNESVCVREGVGNEERKKREQVCQYEVPCSNKCVRHVKQENAIRDLVLPKLKMAQKILMYVPLFDSSG